MPSQRWVAAWIGIGSNLQDPPAQVSRAIAALRRLPRTRFGRASSLYWNPPMGPPGQPDYVNAVAGLLTRLDARELLAALQAIERAAGRERAAGLRWGPRVLDLDLLSYGPRRIAEPGLRVPHPGIAERNFVLLPLLEVAPELLIPGLAPLARLAAAVGQNGLRRLD
ncbi:MAG: 2-amino-4-hydroxy-6-hydroxymethyldihydropteridine diphosphokinase [Gammaproteobacteria bacterium]|nr:MAG: 2-amino-4-hydroxy-6-hydroxymethyldihydropteridine diphosphokinase [Gammaproteobacteria bacterium]